MDKVAAKYPSTSSSDDNFFLYVTHGISQAELALLSVIGSKEKFVVFITFDIFEVGIDFELPENVRVCYKHRSVLTMLPNCKGVITTIGHFSPVLGGHFLDIFRAAAILNLPILEVPHGLYQWGYNLSDTSKVVDLASYHYGSGSFVPSFADAQISWFGDEGIGYPRNGQMSVRKISNAVVPEFVAITTNTNWYLYDAECQRLMFTSIFHLALSMPDAMFIWCPHPAELREESMAFYFINNKPQNLFIYGLDKEIYFHGVDTTEDVIKHAQWGISTVSTCLLDYEIHSKPVLLFTSESTFEICDSISGGGRFSCPADMVSVKPSKICTNLLRDYSVNKFDEALERLGDACSMNKSSNVFAKNLLSL